MWVDMNRVDTNTVPRCPANKKAKIQSEGTIVITHPNRNCKSPLNGGTKEWKVNPLINQFQSGADNFFCRIYDCLQLFPVPSPPFLLASDRIQGTQSTSSTIIIGRNGDTYLVSIPFLTVRSLGRPRYQLRQKASSVQPSLSEPHHPYCSFTPNVALLIN